MNQFRRLFVWLSRIHKCRGFGIQSPTDYAFVRYVLNEHWPYYAYESLNDENWLTQKMGKLFFRLANWKQPTMMLADCYRNYWQRGCRKLKFVDKIDIIQLARVPIENRADYELLLSKCNEQSVLVVDGIWRDWEFWHTIEQDSRTGTTFDLYYCGVIFFDKKRFIHHYKINF